jgi:hypothetical protein
VRDTKYATEIRSVSLTFPSGDEARIERLRIKSSKQIEIRFSWWKNGRMIHRPLDLGERDLMKLLTKAIREGVLLPERGAR